MSSNPIADAIFGLFKTIVWDSWVKYAYTQALATIGLSATGFFGGLVIKIFVWVGNFIFKAMEMFADISTIQLRDAIHRAQFESASQKLGILFIEYGPDSKEFKDAHIKEQSDFFNLITVKPDPLGINS